MKAKRFPRRCKAWCSRLAPAGLRGRPFPRALRNRVPHSFCFHGLVVTESRQLAVSEGGRVFPRRCSWGSPRALAGDRSASGCSGDVPGGWVPATEVPPLGEG